jgi:hypothetical protein
VSACKVGPPVPALFFMTSTFNCDIFILLFSYLFNESSLYLSECIINIGD